MDFFCVFIWRFGITFFWRKRTLGISQHFSHRFDQFEWSDRCKWNFVNYFQSNNKTINVSASKRDNSIVEFRIDKFELWNKIVWISLHCRLNRASGVRVWQHWFRQNCTLHNAQTPFWHLPRKRNKNIEKVTSQVWSVVFCSEFAIQIEKKNRVNHNNCQWFGVFMTKVRIFAGELLAPECLHLLGTALMWILGKVETRIAKTN